MQTGPGMECYFGSHALPKENQANKTAVVAFHIPDLGIRFKAPFDAIDDIHSDFASLLALLEFIDENQKYFAKNKDYKIFGDNLKVVNLVNGLETPPMEYGTLMQKAKTYRQKYRFSLDWIPSKENTSLDRNLD